jgi:ABC-type oligopeptide transport system ATPase subunit
VNESVVNVSELTRRFGARTALASVSLSMSRGAVYGLVGANGAGKTTLIKHVLGLLRAESGSVRVFGLDPVAVPALGARQFAGSPRPGWSAPSLAPSRIRSGRRASAKLISQGTQVRFPRLAGADTSRSTHRAVEVALERAHRTGSTSPSQDVRQAG